MKDQSFLDKCFKDKNGQVVLWQTPNGLILLWAFSEMLSEFVFHDNIQKICSYVAFGSLVVWAFMEILSGVNYFRRGLGLVILIFSIYAKLK